MSAVRPVLAGVCGLLLLAGCSGGAPKAITVSGSAPVVTASQSTSPPVSVEAGKSYVEVLAGGTGVGAMREGLKLTAPNSVAYQYLDHTANMQEASIDEEVGLTAGVGGAHVDLPRPDRRVRLHRWKRSYHT